MNKVLICLISLVVLSTGQRITTIHLDGVQYFISRMNPYSPELNYFLAYQYCRSLGLQLASFETKEKAESMTTYLKNAGYGNYDFWTSGNRLGTGMFLWMSTGLPFNATFDFFENTADAIQAGLLDPVDHNSNTSPQRTARDSSGAEKGCVVLKQPTLKWMPEDCSAVKDFICEQTRCYYYNYGSIPVSSAQGRPITTTTPRSIIADVSKSEMKTTTPLPLLMSSYATAKKSNQPSYVSLKLDQERALVSSKTDDIHNNEQDNEEEHEDDESNNSQGEEVQGRDLTNEEFDHDVEVSQQENSEEVHDEHDEHDDAHEQDDNKSSDQQNDDVSKLNSSHSQEQEEESEELVAKEKSLESYEIENTPELPAVEVRLKEISQEVEKRNNDENRHIPSLTPDLDDIGRQSFLSLTDLIRTLHPNDKQIIPQIDSDYSNAMRVLGEKSVVVNTNEE
ncbi:myb-like protein X isoform X2 [Calliphora vicina]|uniref:myb-like protein X isoform X2 n=2 Tax=Calliphora vicina TaxID=7373 RepID=UPI00325AF2C1